MTQSLQFGTLSRLLSLIIAPGRPVGVKVTLVTLYHSLPPCRVRPPDEGASLPPVPTPVFSGATLSTYLTRGGSQLNTSKKNTPISGLIYKINDFNEYVKKTLFLV